MLTCEYAPGISPVISKDEVKTIGCAETALLRIAPHIVPRWLDYTDGVRCAMPPPVEEELQTELGHTSSISSVEKI